MSFAVRTEGCAPGGCDACLPQKSGTEGMAVEAEGLYIRKGVKSAAGYRAGDTGNLIEGRNYPVTSFPERLYRNWS